MPPGEKGFLIDFEAADDSFLLSSFVHWDMVLRNNLEVNQVGLFCGIEDVEKSFAYDTGGSIQATLWELSFSQVENVSEFISE